MPARPRDLRGEQFGRLTPIEPTLHRVRRSIVWRFRCDCGATVELPSGDVTSGSTQSCGCYRAETSGDRMSKLAPDLNKARATHGMTKTRTFRIWTSMLERCRNPNHKSFDRYGGRGITVCARWESFENFLADMGEAPKGKQIDREKNHLGYEPGNCRWVTSKQNGNNRDNNHSITFQGRTQNIKAWAEELGTSHQTIAHRLKAGWSVEDALTKPIARR